LPRQRFIWPGIWKDPVFGRLNSDEQLLFIGLFSIADDEGRLLADAAYLRSELFPYKKYTEARVRKLKETLDSKCTNIHLYEADGVKYIALLRWSEYQKPKYPTPSKIPPPFLQASPRPPGTLEEDSSMGWVGLGREGLGRVGLGAPPDGVAENLADKSAFKIPNLKDVGS